MIHLAAQAGVRYSIENPRSYLDSNITGTFELLEAARAHPPAHMLLASTSSAYGANTEMPYRETDKADAPLTIYAATKKANEAMAHSYAHLWGIPTTMFRFFTVYGPWGRPDMAPFKFTKGILEGTPPMVALRPQLDRAREAGIGLIGMKAVRYIAGRSFLGRGNAKAFDEHYSPELMQAQLSPFQRSYAFVLENGLDCVNADIQSYDQLRENHIAAATAQQFNTTA